VELVGDEEEGGGCGEVPAVGGVCEEDEGAVPEGEKELGVVSSVGVERGEGVGLLRVK
jgi:hypothetical protein